jgi:hypothetical protein
MCKDGNSPACQSHLLDCLSGWLSFLGMVRLHNPVKEMQSEHNHVHACCTDCGSGICLVAVPPASGRGLCHIRCTHSVGMVDFCAGPRCRFTEGGTDIHRCEMDTRSSLASLRGGN